MAARAIGFTVRLVLLIAAPLPWLHANAAAQVIIAEPRAKSAVGSWQECFDRANASGRDALAEEMERHALETGDRSKDFTGAYLNATRWAIFSPEAKASPEALRARYERARRVADEYGTDDDDRLSVVSNYAIVLVRQLRFKQAIEVLQPAVDLYPNAVKIRANCLELLARALHGGCMFDEAERFAIEAETEVDRAIEAVGRDSELGRLLFKITKHNVLRLRFRIYVELGLLERAGAQLEEIRTWLEAVEAVAVDNDARAEYLRAVISLDRSTARWEHLIATADEILSLDPPPTQGILQDTRINRAVAQMQIASDDEGSLDEPEEALKNAIVDPATELPARVNAIRMLCMLNLARGSYGELRMWTDELRVQLANGGEPVTACPHRGNSAPLATIEACVALRSQIASSELVRVRDEHARAYADFLDLYSTSPLRPEGVSFLSYWDQREVVLTQMRLEIAVDPTDAGCERAFDVLLRAQQLGTFGRTVGAPIASLRELREELLSSETGLIAYLPGTEHSCVALVDRDGVQIVDLGRRIVLVDAARAFQTELGRPLESGASAAAAEERVRRWLSAGSALREHLFPPELVAAVEKWKGFYVCGLEFLENPSIEGLPWIRGQALGIEKAIGYLPSVHVGVWLARRERTPQSSADPSLLVFAAPRQSAALGDASTEIRAPLEISDAVLRRVARPFPDAAWRSFVAESATVENLRSACSRSVGMLELFAHGVHDFRRGRPSGIALTPSGSDDGRLWCDGIETGIQSPRLVALFACGSAISPIRVGDDTAAHLGNAFLRSGAQTVLLCRADVAYGAMLDLAAAFNRELARGGVSPAEALRSARATLARSAEWKDPFYFGHVSALGLALEPWNPPPTPQTSLMSNAAAASAPRAPQSTTPVVPLFAVGAVVAIAAAAAIARKRRRNV